MFQRNFISDNEVAQSERHRTASTACGTGAPGATAGVGATPYWR